LNWKARMRNSLLKIPKTQQNPYYLRTEPNLATPLTTPLKLLDEFALRISACLQA
jgi:hypothetical protein